MKNTYLKIGETVCEGALLPAAVLPAAEILKNEERSINGTMNVDIIGRKHKLTVNWTVLQSAPMQTLMRLVSAAQTYTVEYCDASGDASAPHKRTLTAYISAFTYTPLFIDDDCLRWQDVSLELTEM